MKNPGTAVLVVLLMICGPLFAQGSKPAEADAWTKALKEGAKRGTLHDAFQNVRGDTGKWNDKPILQHALPIEQKPAKMPLDDWADQLLQRDFQTTSKDDNWLLLRTRQLDDNDRAWVERIERRGNEFTIVLHEAIWQGRYSKTFTYYSAFGVNVGKLAPGKYEAKCIIKPLAFKQFDGDGRSMDNWPKDERPTDQKPTELRVTFSVVDKVGSSEN